MFFGPHLSVKTGEQEGSLRNLPESIRLGKSLFLKCGIHLLVSCFITYVAFLGKCTFLLEETSQSVL